jgi:hypothetical protein
MLLGASRITPSVGGTYEERAPVLQSLLPGFRYLRAPLAAGYIWLIALWFASRDVLTSRGQFSEVSSRVAEMANWAGKPATLAATTLVAYLVGVLSIALTGGISRIAGLLRVPSVKWLVPGHGLDKRIEDSLRGVVERKFSDYYVEEQKFRDTLKEHLAECTNKAKVNEDRLVPSVYNLLLERDIEKKAVDDEHWRKYIILLLVDVVEYVRSAKEDIEHLAYRLLGKEEKVYDEYDRRQSEGIFRLALVLPLASLFLVLASVDDMWWILGLPAPVAFSYLAAASFAEAKRGLASAVSSGRVELSSLERIRTRDVKLVPYESLVAKSRPSLPDPYFAPDRWRIRPWPK